MTEALVNLVIKQRDAIAQQLDAWNEFLESLSPTEQKAKTVSEETFVNLTYEEQNTEKLGKFDTADPKQNDEKRFGLAFSVLRANGSTISKRYHGSGYIYSYWIYTDRIYRQLLKK
jgi:hypothetical protein